MFAMLLLLACGDKAQDSGLVDTEPSTEPATEETATEEQTEDTSAQGGDTGSAQ